MAQKDPFYLVRDKVQQALGALSSDLSSIDDKLRSYSPSSASYSQIDGALSRAKDALVVINTDVKDLGQTIVIVEENRHRFPSITNEELADRKKFVASAKSEAKQLQDQIHKLQQKYDTTTSSNHSNSSSALIPPTNNARKSLLEGGSSSGGSRFSAAANQEASRTNDDYISNTRQQQQLLISQQDDVLTDMTASLARLQQIGDEIGKEIKEQDAELDELDTELNIAQDGLKTTIKKMERLLKKSDKGRLCCICLLLITIAILFFTLIYS